MGLSYSNYFMFRSTCYMWAHELFSCNLMMFLVSSRFWRLSKSQLLSDQLFLRCRILQRMVCQCKPQNELTFLVDTHLVLWMLSITAECTPQQAFSIVGDHVVFASGSPFSDVELGMLCY